MSKNKNQRRRDRKARAKNKSQKKNNNNLSNNSNSKVGKKFIFCGYEIDAVYKLIMIVFILGSVFAAIVGLLWNKIPLAYNYYFGETEISLVSLNSVLDYVIENTGDKKLYVMDLTVNLLGANGYIDTRTVNEYMNPGEILKNRFHVGKDELLYKSVSFPKSDLHFWENAKKTFLSNYSYKVDRCLTVIYFSENNLDYIKINNMMNKNHMRPTFDARLDINYRDENNFIDTYREYIVGVLVRNIKDANCNNTKFMDSSMFK